MASSLDAVRAELTRAARALGAPESVEPLVERPRDPSLGDAIASLLEWAGWQVTREFYYNDAGAQIHNLALSVQARIRQAAGEQALVPEGGYHGEYIKEIAQRYVAERPGDPR